MKELVMTASNLMLVPTEAKTLEPIAELILGVSETHYFETAEGAVKNRPIETVRLYVNRPIIGELIKTLSTLNDTMAALDREHNMQK